MANQYIRYPNPVSSSTITGSGTSGQVAYFNGANSITGNSGLTYSSNQLTLAAGTVGAPSLIFSGSATTGIFQSAADYLDFSVQGVNRISIRPDNTFRMTGSTLHFSNTNGDCHLDVESLVSGEPAVYWNQAVRDWIGGVGSDGTWRLKRGTSVTTGGAIQVDINDNATLIGGTTIGTSGGGLTHTIYGTVNTSQGNVSHSKTSADMVLSLSSVTSGNPQIYWNGNTRDWTMAVNGTSGLFSIARGPSVAAGDLNIDTGGNVTLPNGNLKITTAGRGIFIKEGSNAYMGTATLSGGTIVVSNTTVTASTRIFLTTQSVGVLANLGTPYISARTAATSFTINSSNILDTSTIAWIMVEPA